MRKRRLLRRRRIINLEMGSMKNDYSIVGLEVKFTFKYFVSSLDHFIAMITV